MLGADAVTQYAVPARCSASTFDIGNDADASLARVWRGHRTRRCSLGEEGTGRFTRSGVTVTVPSAVLFVLFGRKSCISGSGHRLRPRSFCSLVSNLDCVGGCRKCGVYVLNGANVYRLSSRDITCNGRCRVARQNISRTPDRRFRSNFGARSSRTLSVRRFQLRFAYRGYLGGCSAGMKSARRSHRNELC